MMIARRVCLFAALNFVLLPSAAAQESNEATGTHEACSAPELRQFDFWLGDWTVTDASGKRVGANTITRVARGCGLHENWRGASGGAGMSLNWYEAGTDLWHQVWVGVGTYLHLKGGLEGGNMVLRGERQADGATVLDRITWQPLEDGRVQQTWDVSRDGGRSWQSVFNGTYTRK